MSAMSPTNLAPRRSSREATRATGGRGERRFHAVFTLTGISLRAWVPRDSANALTRPGGVHADGAVRASTRGGGRSGAGTAASGVACGGSQARRARRSAGSSPRMPMRGRRPPRRAQPRRGPPGVAAARRVDHARWPAGRRRGLGARRPAPRCATVASRTATPRARPTTRAPPHAQWAPGSRASVTSGRPGTDAHSSSRRPRSAHPRARGPPPSPFRPRLRAGPRPGTRPRRGMRPRAGTTRRASILPWRRGLRTVLGSRRSEAGSRLDLRACRAIRETQRGFATSEPTSLSFHETTGPRVARRCNGSDPRIPGSMAGMTPLSPFRRSDRGCGRPGGRGLPQARGGRLPTGPRMPPPSILRTLRGPVPKPPSSSRPDRIRMLPVVLHDGSRAAWRSGDAVGRTLGQPSPSARHHASMRRGTGQGRGRRCSTKAHERCE